MNEHLVELAEPAHTDLRSRETAVPARRSRHSADERLTLAELSQDAVIDHLDSPSEPVELITFGSVRETCPRCQGAHLKLVLRQRRVRIAHLFCEQCLGCYDAQYTNGTSALTL